MIALFHCLFESDMNVRNQGQDFNQWTQSGWRILIQLLEIHIPHLIYKLFFFSWNFIDVNEFKISKNAPEFLISNLTTLFINLFIREAFDWNKTFNNFLFEFVIEQPIWFLKVFQIIQAWVSRVCLRICLNNSWLA